MSGHTPGPWMSQGTMVVAIENADTVICAANYVNKPMDVARANARLIGAAPDLLEAVMALLAAADHTLPEEWRRDRPVTLAKAAIMKSGAQ